MLDKKQLEGIRKLLKEAHEIDKQVEYSIWCLFDHIQALQTQLTDVHKILDKKNVYYAKALSDLQEENERLKSSANTFDAIKDDVEDRLGRVWKDAQKHVNDNMNFSWVTVCHVALKYLVQEFGDGDSLK